VEGANYKRYLIGLHTDVFGHFDFDGSILFLHSKPAKFTVETKVEGKVQTIKLRERLDSTNNTEATANGAKEVRIFISYLSSVLALVSHHPFVPCFILLIILFCLLNR